MILVVGGNKGGIAKSTTVVQLAVYDALHGKDSVLFDADRQGSGAKFSLRRENAGVEPALTVIQKYDNISKTLLQMEEKFENVWVDVAGRNSREFITAGMVADVIISPLQASELDAETLDELKEQAIAWRDINPDLKIYIYHTQSTTNPIIRGRERQEFLDSLKGYEEYFVPLESVSCFRTVYRTSMKAGLGVLEADNELAKEEVINLYKEVMNG